MTDLPNWAEGIKQESLEKALAAGEILPHLPLPDVPEGKTTSDETVFARFLTDPYRKRNPKTEKDMWVAEVEHQGARKNTIVPESLRFNLLKECKLHGLDGAKGHWFVIGAHLQNTQYGKNQKLYWCQCKPRHAEEAQEQQAFGQSRKEEPSGSSSPLDRAFDLAR